MPQFDFTTYLSQIFWFGLCFAILFLSAHYLILPRIREIIKKRSKLIETDQNLASEISIKTEEINKEAEMNLQQANLQYQNKIAEILKTNQQIRDKKISELKENLEQKVSKSRAEIKEFIENSKTNNTKIINSIIEIIKNKITQ
ncbi:MAG: hypothetical protein ACO201_05710 [Rickettsiales bacterium]